MGEFTWRVSDCEEFWGLLRGDCMDNLRTNGMLFSQSIGITGIVWKANRVRVPLLAPNLDNIV